MDFGLGRVSWVLNLKTDNRPAGNRVSKVGNRVRLPESSNQVAANQTATGRTSWVGRRFAWTPLITTHLNYKQKVCAANSFSSQH